MEYKRKKLPKLTEQDAINLLRKLLDEGWSLSMLHSRIYNSGYVYADILRLVNSTGDHEFIKKYMEKIARGKQIRNKFII